ncbi:hypothetical protein MUO66_01600, partial [Candidatus Bathyarchaeota archaeon]|nr:hypothetical protein [Candidatus Bathyarchaeota archaeon]
MANVADKVLNNEIELFLYLAQLYDTENKYDPENKIYSESDININLDYSLDFSIYNLSEYFTPKPV